MSGVVVDLSAARIERLGRALEAIERWASQSADEPYVDPDWLSKRSYVADHDNETAEEYMLELHESAGTISAYVDTMVRIASLRGMLAAQGTPRARYESVVEALRGELAWADAEREEAFLAVGRAVEPDELQAKGRATAFVAIRVEFRSLIDGAPQGAL